ncbi:MAG: carboxypeptidase-like regulatory domain-containing protein [Bacteroidota bacterium]
MHYYIRNNFKSLMVLLIFCFGNWIPGFCQTHIFTGNITDAVTGEPLPYVAVSLRKNLLSTVSNENGNFDFNIPVEITDDSIVISSIGYAPQTYSMLAVPAPFNIKLQPNSFQLKEVMILPMPPTYYINLAMNSIKQNYPDNPFQSEAYYREKMTENDNIIKFTEAVFNSYYPNYTDTAAKDSHQLLLFNKADDKKIAFMNNEDKKKRKKKKKQEDGEVAMTDTSDNAAINIKEIFGGPDEILSLDIVRDKEEFLDSNEFRHFNYSFAASSTYENKELMVIDFESRRRMDHVDLAGKIYIDLESNAIVNIDYIGDFRLPALIQPILFVMGIHIEKPIIRKKLEYQKINSKWYPKHIQAGADLNLTKRHLFSKNEHSHIVIDGIFTVNKLITEKANAIPEAKKYSKKKKMEEQVFNDEHITWDQINVIKR